MLEIGSVVDGKYKILNKIGQGGMSVVYLAMNERANKQWAIKEVRKDGVQNFEVVQQGLIAEVNMLKRLDHPNLPSIIDVIEEEGRFLIVMDYIEGNTLAKALQEYGAQPQEQVIEWAIQLCDVLGYLHTRKPPIIYRDMKPSNVMLKPDGNVTLIDFGTAREYKSSSIADTTCLGTLGYAAPEQFGGYGQTDGRTDIYCLGATLYHLVTGQSPCDPPYEIYPIRYWNPELSSGLERIIVKCTQRNPEDRYQTCAELLYDLEHYRDLDEENTRKRNIRLALFGTTAALCVLCGGISLGSHLAEGHVKNNSYEACMLSAEGTRTEEEAADMYAKAIDLEPGKGEAYLQVLENVFLQDDNFTSEEDQLMRRMLNDAGSGRRTHEEAFSLNRDMYEEFAYRLGLAYFYSYEGNGNKGMSTKWLRIAAESETLDANKVERAAKLSRIAEYYTKIGVVNKSGDANTSYGDYWKDLTDLAYGNIAAADNVTTAMMVYKELVYQIYNHALEFRAAGVEQSAMMQELDYISQHLESDIIILDDANKTRNLELKNKLRENLEQARRQVATAFETSGGGGK